MSPNDNRRPGPDRTAAQMVDETSTNVQLRGDLATLTRRIPFSVALSRLLNGDWRDATGPEVDYHAAGLDRRGYVDEHGHRRLEDVRR